MSQTIFHPSTAGLSLAKIIEAGESMELVYVNESQKGIAREKAGDAFIYRFKGRKLTNTKELARIKRPAIPPACTEVWICKQTQWTYSGSRF